MKEDHRELLRRISIASIRLDGAYDRLSKKVGVKANLLWLLYALDDGIPKAKFAMNGFSPAPPSTRSSANAGTMGS